MKTILLYVGAALLLSSCDAPSNTHASESLTDNEMKSQVEVEEIHFEKETEEALDTHEKKRVANKGPFQFEYTPQPGHGDPLPDYPESPPIMVNPKPLPPSPFLPNQFEKPIDTVDYFPQVDAVFPGGKIEMNKFITSNWEHQNREISNEGRVYVSMIIEKDGSIRNVQISRGF